MFSPPAPLVLFRCMLVMVLIVLFRVSAYSAPIVKTGAQLSAESGFQEFAGKRVGLITNHTAVVNGAHLIDLLNESASVRLTALFAPEHGLRGLEEDGVAIAEGKDQRTRVGIYSLYGKRKKPTPEMLRDLDVLVYDIQDIGARFYTFISTMGMAMEAAAAAGIPFVVLDRPNPLGGEYVAGPIVEKPFASFVGLYPIPVAHGMTAGELALMIKGERMLPGLDKLDLRVVKMTGWVRYMQWPDTGLTWVKTSPNIPDFETALLYPGLCFIEATRVSEGRGTLEPFKQVGIPFLDSLSLAAVMSSLPGLSVEPVCFTPRSLPGMSSSPKYRNTAVTGIRLTVTDRRTFAPVEAGVHLLASLFNAAGESGKERFFQKRGFDLLAGTDSVRRAVLAGVSPETIIAGWDDGVRRFMAQRSRYLLY